MWAAFGQASAPPKPQSSISPAIPLMGRKIPLMRVENSAVLPSSGIGQQALEFTEFQAARSASFHGQSEDYSDFSAANSGINLDQQPTRGRS
jgi:hypothetical protein